MLKPLSHSYLNEDYLKSCNKNAEIDFILSMR
jgi:hypothetical protein